MTRTYTAEMVEPLTDDELALLVGLLDHARNGTTDPLMDAIERGIPVDLASNSGDTLLILAAYHVHPETVAALLQHGADTERVNDRGQTALGAAVFRSATDIVQMLLAAGADPAGGGRTALEIAEFFELPEMTAQLRSSPPPRG
jgi:ankyrin repeat protein